MRWREGRHTSSPALAYLLQHGLLWEVELLEPLVLIVTGGVQVVGIHLEAQGQAQGLSGTRRELEGTGRQLRGAEAEEAWPLREVAHQVHCILLVGLRQGSRHEGLPLLLLLIRQLCTGRDST